MIGENNLNGMKNNVMERRRPAHTTEKRSVNEIQEKLFPFP
jgi:hypothetical protein